MSERTIIKLRSPVQFGEQAIPELSFRKGRMGDLKGVEIGEDGLKMDNLMRVAARMAGVPLEVIEQVGEEDAGEVCAIALGFIRRCLATGSAQ